MAIDPVSSIASAITEGFKLLAQWQRGATVRRMRNAIEAGEKYILTNEDNDLTVKKRSERLDKYRNRFFKFNN